MIDALNKSLDVRVKQRLESTKAFWAKADYFGKAEISIKFTV